MSTRVRINLAVFAALFVALLWWDVTNVLRPDAYTRPYHVTAEFATSPGLRSGFGVTYRGVQVGQLGSVKLVGHHVRVDLKIDRGVKLPAGVDAAVRRKSVVGEPYVDLTPTGGRDPGGARLKGGAVIPLARTTTPLDYSTLFNSVSRLLDAVPTADLNRLLHATAVGVEGRGEDFRRLIASATQFTGDVAKDGPLLDQLADDLTTLVHTLATHRDSLGKGFDNLASLAQVLADNKANLVALLDKTPTLLHDVGDLLAKSGPDIGCTVDAAGGLFHTLNTPAILGSFTRLIDLSPETAAIVRSIRVDGPDGPYIGGGLVFTATLDPPKVFKTPLALPKVTPVPRCNAPRVEGTAGAPSGTAGAGSGSSAVGNQGVGTPSLPATSKPSLGPSSAKKVNATGWKSYLWPALIGLLVLAALLGFTVLRPWDRIKARLAGGRGGPDGASPPDTDGLS